MSNTLTTAMIFLSKTIFDLYLLALCARLILAFAQANYFNPITRFVIMITQPIIAPLRQVIPTYFRIEFSTLLLMILLATLKLFVISHLLSVTMSIDSLLMEGLFSAIKLILTVLFYAILISGILSLLTPVQTPLSQVLTQLASPVLRPIQRLIPPVGGFDVSPIPALIILKLFIRLL